MKAIATAAILLVLAACSGSTNAPAQFLDEPTDPLTNPPAVIATSAPTLAPEPTRKPGKTPRPTPKPTKKPSADYYTPRGWSGGDVDCKDFDTHRQAQSFFKGTGGTKTNDPHGLDADHDGLACESLP